MILLRILFFLVLSVIPTAAQDRSFAGDAKRLLDAAKTVISPKVDSDGFTRIAEVNRVFWTPGEAERAVKFRGVVIQSVPSQNYFFIQQDNSGIQVTLAKEVPVPALGDEVEVEARVKFVVANGDSTVRATSIRVTGSPGVTMFKKPKLAEIRAGKFNRQAVEVEAAVLHAFQVSVRGFEGWWLLLSDDDGACLGGIYSHPKDWTPMQLVGKRIRFRGLGMPGSEFILRCSSPDEITVIGEAEGSSALKPITSVKAVREYGLERTRQRQYPMLMHGICTYVHPEKNRYFIHDGTGGAEIKCRPEMCPAPGDEVFVPGILAPGGGAVYLVGWNLEVLAKNKQATPEKWDMSPISHNEHWGDYFETDAVVINAQISRQNGASYFYVTENNAWMKVTVNSPPPAPPGGWWNAKVRIRGALVHDTHVRLWCSGGKDFAVLTPGVAAPFDVPAVSAAALRKTPLSASRVRVKGTVLTSGEGWIFLRDETGAFRTDTATHFEPTPQFDVLPNFVLWPSTGLKPGDEVEVAGSPMAPDAGLRFSTVRVIKSGEFPAPKTIKLSAAAKGTAANDLVTLRGRLISHSSGFASDSYAARRWRETLRLDDGNGELEVVYETAEKRSNLSTFIINDLIEATGILRPEGGVPAYRLRVRTVDDLRTLGPDPSVMRTKIIRIGIVASILLAAALSWVWVTRRTVALRTKQLAAANEQLNAALTQEREVGDLKSRFVSLVSHEFRTPLGVTMSAVELLRHYRERLPAEELDQLHGDIHSATLRMSSMMEQILLLGRADAGKLAFQTVPIILAEITDKLRDEMVSATNNKCPIEYIVENDISGAVGDEAILRHIFSNLLSNAVKYSPAGSPVQFRVYRKGANAIFTIKDSGIGIPKADQTKLFEAFHRAGNVGEREGTGLGLLIVKRCVELHGGTIDFHSEEGKGTLFTVTLPLFK